MKQTEQVMCRSCKTVFNREEMPVCGMCAMLGRKSRGFSSVPDPDTRRSSSSRRRRTT